MGIRDVRIQRLRQFARSKGVEDSPSGLGKLIGKEPNQVTNLLRGHSSFGEKVARSIEETAGLAPGWLDQEEEGFTPEIRALVRAINSLPDPENRTHVLKLCNALVKEMGKLSTDKKEPSTAVQQKKM